MTGPASNGLGFLFIPAVSLLIFFLGYTSQWLFNTDTSLDLAGGPLTTNETYTFNALLALIWWTYYKACTVPPGRYTFPKPDDDSSDPSSSSSAPADLDRTRWCRKCAAPKPPRAHHCRTCRACIPKMDHHCPWTANCVSLQTFPYFLRFLAWANAGLWYLLSLLGARYAGLYANRDQPSYLGPTPRAMAHLVLLGAAAGITALALGVLLAATARGWALNVTMIDGWEADRHEAVLLRHKKGGWWAGANAAPGGVPAPARIERVEFPYDVGFFANMSQAMGTRNVLMWFFPFAGGPVVSETCGKGTGWEWEENGFNDREGMWPPVDPEKARLAANGRISGWPGSAAARQAEEAEGGSGAKRTPEEERAAFKARQEMDLRRRQGMSGIIAELEEDEDIDDYDFADGDEEEEEAPGVDDHEYYEQGLDGEPGWTNSDGDRLRDYGVDEDAEEDLIVLEDDDVPLAELIRRRKVLVRDDNDE